MNLGADNVPVRIASRSNIRRILVVNDTVGDVVIDVVIVAAIVVGAVIVDVNVVAVNLAAVNAAPLNVVAVKVVAVNAVAVNVVVVDAVAVNVVAVNVVGVLVVIDDGGVAVGPVHDMFDVAVLLVENDNVVVGLRFLVAYLVVCPDDNYSISPMGGGSFRFGIAAEDEHLKKDEEIDGYLERAADPELQRGFSQEEVGGLEYVTARPHYHHADTVKKEECILCSRSFSPQ